MLRPSWKTWPRVITSSALAGVVVVAGLSPAGADPEPEHPWQAPDWPQTQPWQETAASNSADPPEILTRDGAPEPIDPQEWVNPDHMTWDDYEPVPETDWANPDQEGSELTFTGALVLADYPDQDFAVTQPPESTAFGNPTTEAAGIDRDDVADFYHDFLNVPGELNRGHTVHEYWMEGSGGRYGVDLDAFGPYELPGLAHEYGIGRFQEDEDCPAGDTCAQDLPQDANDAWLAEEGQAIEDEFDFVFYLSAGEDESGTWQEFGPMMFAEPEDVTDEFGPDAPDLPNHANTRYVDWTSWAAAANYWPHAGPGYSVQSESSGHAVYAHELSHILGIADNYNNPYGEPMRRSYTGIWSMLSRGTFNGPGGPHSRFVIPTTAGGTMGSHHVLRDKMDLDMVDTDSEVLQLSRDGLAESGLTVAEVTARSAATAGDDELAGINIVLEGGDNSPQCDWREDLYCDGSDYDNYTIEVVDRMGFDSFTPDSGVMLAKTKDEDDPPFVWTVDANPGDIEMVDFVWPDGTPEYITLGDYRQLSNALFHAGTDSGSEFEYVDEDNQLHFYILDMRRDADGILSYQVGVRSLADNGAVERGVDMTRDVAVGEPNEWVHCEMTLSNTGATDADTTADVYRLQAEAVHEDWDVWLPNELATAEAGQDTTVEVYANRTGDAPRMSEVELTATSESDSEASASDTCATVAR